MSRGSETRRDSESLDKKVSSQAGMLINPCPVRYLGIILLYSGIVIISLKLLKFFNSEFILIYSDLLIIRFAPESKYEKNHPYVYVYIYLISIILI